MCNMLFSGRYHSLVTKYGRLQPLAEIDLRPRFRARVNVLCEEKVEQVCYSPRYILYIERMTNFFHQLKHLIWFDGVLAFFLLCVR